MTITLSLAWWHIPTVITVLTLLWAFCWPIDDAGWWGGIARVIMLVPALFIALLAWAIAGALK